MGNSTTNILLTVIALILLWQFFPDLAAIMFVVSVPLLAIYGVIKLIMKLCGK